MLGFIKKDLSIIKSNLKIILVLLLVYITLAITDTMDIAFIIPFMSLMLMISTFSYDTYNKFDAYAATLPNGRKNSVKGKYLTTLILVISSAILITIITMAIAYFKEGVLDFEYTLMNMFGVIFATGILITLLYPSMYKFGVEKARIGMFIIVFALAIIVGFMANFFDFADIITKLDALEKYFMIILPLLLIASLYLSYFISLKIYLSKEF